MDTKILGMDIKLFIYVISTYSSVIKQVYCSVPLQGVLSSRQYGLKIAAIWAGKMFSLVNSKKPILQFYY